MRVSEKGAGTRMAAIAGLESDLEKHLINGLNGDARSRHAALEVSQRLQELGAQSPLIQQAQDAAAGWGLDKK